MGTESKEKTYIQCMDCGHVYTVDRLVPFEFSVINVCCPKCEYNRGLNCGHDEDDLYELADPFLDKRYY